MSADPRPPVIVDGRTYAGRRVTRAEAQAHDTPRERRERWT